jgi:hypothetical protein
LALQIFTDEFIDKSCCGSWGFAIKILSDTKVVEEFSSLIGMELVVGWEFIIFENLEFAERLHHWHSSPWSRPIDFDVEECQ